MAFTDKGKYDKYGSPGSPNREEALLSDIEESRNNGGATISIPATAYATNAAALTALGVGKLYKSTTLINGSPIILITA